MSGTSGDPDGQWSISSGHEQKKRSRAPSGDESRPPKRSLNKSEAARGAAAVVAAASSSSSSLPTAAAPPPASDRSSSSHRIGPPFEAAARLASPSEVFVAQPRFRDHQPIQEPHHPSAQTGSTSVGPDAGHLPSRARPGRWHGGLHNVSADVAPSAGSTSRTKQRCLSETYSTTTVHDAVLYPQPSPRGPALNHSPSTADLGGNAAGGGTRKQQASRRPASTVLDPTLGPGTPRARTKTRPRLGHVRHGSTHEQQQQQQPVGAAAYSAHVYRSASFNSPSTFRSSLPTTAPPPPASCLTPIGLSSPSMSDAGRVFSPASTHQDLGPLSTVDTTASTSQAPSVPSPSLYNVAAQPGPHLGGVLAGSSASAHWPAAFAHPSHPASDPFATYTFHVSQTGSQALDNHSQLHSQQALQFGAYTFSPDQYSLYGAMRYPVLGSSDQDLTFGAAQMDQPVPATAESQEQHSRARVPGDAAQMRLNEDGHLLMEQSPSQTNEPFMVVVRSPGGPVAVPEADPSLENASGSDDAMGDEIKEEAEGYAASDAEDAEDSSPEGDAQSSRSVASSQQKASRKRFSQDERKITAETRKQKACVRCQMQRCRCVPGDGEECATCCKVDAKSKKIIHRLPCLRYRITEVVLSRPDVGERGSLKLTKRWKAFDIQDIDKADWETDIIRTIKLTLDKCGTNSTVIMEMQVRKFKPRPGDVLYRRWRDGHKLKEKALEPYALADIRAYTQKFKAYVHENAWKAMSSYSTRLDRNELYRDAGGEAPLVAKTYMFAVQHYHRLRVHGRPESEQHEECQFMGALIKLWFAIRHTVGSSSLCGDDTLDMKPEMTDHTYPLRARVSTPRMIIEQVDAINASIIAGLRKAVLKVLERYFKNNRPAQWITLYLATFILLHEVDVATEDRRRHGLANNTNPKEWYSLPYFVQQLQQGANILLAFWHYYRADDDPSEISAGDWRNNTRMSSMSSEQFAFLQMSAEELKMQRAVYERGRDTLWEGPLFWVSQMFVKSWRPGVHFVA